mmetsp:Transcript_13037/g.33981  ORF Transcript_13037/g.33981 Transcript_13037/m.33981 type:complete len:296 (+) Transcript_13037:814-1701(+)
MDAHQQAVVHHLHALEQLAVDGKLLQQHLALVVADVQRTRQPAGRVLHRHRLLCRHAQRRAMCASAAGSRRERRPAQVVPLVQWAVGWEDVAHHDRVERRAQACRLYAVQPEEAREKTQLVTQEVGDVRTELACEEMRLALRERSHEEAVVRGESEELARLGVGVLLCQKCAAAQRLHVLSLADANVRAQRLECTRRICLDVERIESVRWSALGAAGGKREHSRVRVVLVRRAGHSRFCCRELCDYAHAKSKRKESLVVGAARREVLVCALQRPRIFELGQGDLEVELIVALHRR